MLNLVLLCGTCIIATSDFKAICISTHSFILESNYRSNLLTLTAVRPNLIKVLVDFTGTEPSQILHKYSPFFQERSAPCVYSVTSPHLWSCHHFLAEQWQLLEQEFNCSVLLLHYCPQSHFWSSMYSVLLQTEISEVQQALLKAKPLHLPELHAVLKIQQ